MVLLSDSAWLKPTTVDIVEYDEYGTMSMDECIKQSCDSHVWFSFDQVEFNNLPTYDISLKNWLMLSLLCKSKVYVLHF